MSLVQLHDGNDVRSRSAALLSPLPSAVHPPPDAVRLSFSTPFNGAPLRCPRAAFLGPAAQQPAPRTAAGRQLAAPFGQAAAPSPKGTDISPPSLTALRPPYAEMSMIAAAALRRTVMPASRRFSTGTAFPPGASPTPPRPALHRQLCWPLFLGGGTTWQTALCSGKGAQAAVTSSVRSRWQAGLTGGIRSGVFLTCDAPVMRASSVSLSTDVRQLTPYRRCAYDLTRSRDRPPGRWRALPRPEQGPRGRQDPVPRQRHPDVAEGHHGRHGQHRRQPHAGRRLHHHRASPYRTPNRPP